MSDDKVDDRIHANFSLCRTSPQLILLSTNSNSGHTTNYVCSCTRLSFGPQSSLGRPFPYGDWGIIGRGLVILLAGLYVYATL